MLTEHQLIEARGYNTRRLAGRLNLSWLPWPMNQTSPTSTCFVYLAVSSQLELQRLGLYDGDIDGMLGPKHEAALADVSPVSGPVVRGPEVGGYLPQAHLAPNGYRDGRGSRARPLVELPADLREKAETLDNVALMHEIVDFLDVEHSKRWLPRDGATYCNIYGADFVYLWALLGKGQPYHEAGQYEFGDIYYEGGCYLPRVWWYDSALHDIQRGKLVEPVYAKTVREMNANSLHNWLYEFGPQFGWVLTDDPETLQEAVNGGRLGVIVCRRKPNAEGRRYSGHVSVVVPGPMEEAGNGYPIAYDGSVYQSQAGSTNRASFRNVAGQGWWRSSRFDGVAMAFQKA